MEESEKADSEPIPTKDDASPSQGKSCALCGCATPAVRCDRCNSQIFCLSCDDMYHRHPKRKLHLRKAVDSIWTTARSPRLRRRTELPGDPCKIPIPPPRSKKREHRTIGGRTFLKSGLELGSFGHSKVFSPASKDFFAGQKSPASMVESNCDDGTPSPNIRSESGQIYENDNITNATGNLDDRSPWNPRPNISSPIQVSIPSSSPDIVTNGQPFGYPAKPHSQSAADLTAHTGHPVGHHPYHFHPPYPPYMHPPMHPYSHSMAHLNCAQCISNSWSNLISPHPSPYFHPMPWGSAQNTLARPPLPGQPGPMKHSHGDLSTYPDSGFHYPYPGAPYYHNGPPVVDPNFIKDLHEQAEMQKQRKEAKSSPRNEEMDIATNPSPVADESSSAPTAGAPTADAPSTEPTASTAQDAQAIDEAPPAPIKPTEPWSCVHCTYINPPGSHICEVCCKTSYGNKPSDAMEEQKEDRPDSRDTDSPLINRDALMNSPGVSEIRDAQKDIDVPITTQASDFEYREQKTPSDISTSPAPIKLTTETQTFTTTKTTDVQTQNITRKSIASSTDSIFPKQEMSVQTEIETLAKHCSVATDPMISSQSLESLLSGVSAPPYHNRRAGWGRGATSFSTQSLYERGRSRSPMPRSHSFHTEAPAMFGQDSSFASEEAMHSASQAWLYADPMYYKPHNRVLGQSLAKEDYFDGTWGSMDRLNHRVKHKKDKEKLDVRPKFHRSLDDLKPDEKKPEFIRTHELMMLQTVKEAERCGFTLDDLHVAYLHCGKENPVFWLEDNWPQMIKNVIGLAAKYGEENEENDVGAITTTEAKEALRIHRGDIWDAVAECIETRQRKILELTVRGNFTQKQIAETLKNNEGNVELAYADLLRASTRRHKFILSPGLSTDSEDLNVYNPTEDSTADHNLSVSPLKAAKHDAAAESKSEKKKSDFLTKLTAIREAQSERRKAREEKELIRETITQDLPISAESEAVLKKDISIELTPSISREDSKEVEEILQGGMPEREELLPENKLETEVLESKDVPLPKETVEDSIPVDFDTNWSESQGEWIEEYSDEHWEEGDEHWGEGLGKKFQKMQKEFEEEAMQMAALWEKEELEDDVFEEETKVQQENEPAVDSDKKFDDWVKANLKADSLEYEEDIEMKGQPQDENLAAISLRERLDLEGSRPSPLQHYATALDLSLKSQFESDWVDLPADAEIEKLAHDIVCEGSDVENKFDEPEMVMYEEEKPLRKISDQGSDEDWEKIEMDEQLQEVNELDHFAFPEKEGDMDREAEEEILDISDKGTELPSEITSEITIGKDTTVLYKNLESIRAADASDIGIIATESLEASDTVSVQPKAPVRRKSKLSSTDLDEALKSQPVTEISSDIPPPLPEKSRHKGDQQKVLDIYAVPDKTAKVEDHIDKDLPSVPQKPPRLNLSPTVPEERAKISQKILTKEGSPITSLSYESDSNFFADSESETEMKLHRPKNIHKKLAKYENELEDSEIKDISVEKLPKRTVKEKKEILESPFDLEISQTKFEENMAKEKEDVLESNFDLELDDDIDPSLIEPLPRMKDIDYDPELPILLGGRGRQISDIDDVDAPKAFREDTTRPLQLFKVIKKETSLDSVDMPATTAVESQPSETSFIQRISNELPMPAPTSNISYEPSMKLSEPVAGENEAKERFYYNDSSIPQQSMIDTHMPQFQPQEFLRKEEIVKETEPVIQATPATQEEEIPLQEMEALSAVADYFFGRYNEVTVTPTKKKTSTRARPLTASATKSPSKVMSSSEISSPPQLETTQHMDQSAAAVLQVKPLPEDEQTSTVTKISDQQKTVMETAVIKEAIPSPEKPKPPAPTECLSFAEDYLFGCYNQVVPPKKTKNVPVISGKIPKLGEIQSLSRPQTPLKEQKLSSPISTPEPPELPLDKQEEEMLGEDVPEEDENDVSIRTDTSATYDDVFHDLPPEMLSNQSFDESSIYYESFQDAVEEVQGNSTVDGNMVNVRPKTVHFEEPQAPLVPPRRKTRGPQKGKAPRSSDQNESYANEYLFRQYEIQPQDKKKLPLRSKDFRMNQGFEPPETPSDTSLTPEEEEEEEICSETSDKIPLKSNELLKSTLECDFGDSEQPLELIEHDTKKTELKHGEIFAKSDDSIPHLEDNLLLVEKKLEITSNLRQDDVSTDNQSEKSESFEELSIPDNMEEIIESSSVSEQFYAEKKASSITESEVVSIQQAQSYDTNETSNRMEMDQFVFIEQAQDIIDDSYNLYDIQGSLVCDLNYVDVKGNIEDECTDDSEQEWKRNEDRKNTLNASFLANTPIKKVTDSEEESTVDKSQQYDQKETVIEELQNVLETVIDETEKSDTEIEQKIDVSKIVADNEEKFTLDKSQQYDKKEPVLEESQNELETVLDETQKSDAEIEQKIDGSKTVADSAEESTLDKSQQYDQKEPILEESQIELETVLDEAQKSDIEIEQKIDESKITQSQVERKSAEDQNLEEDFELMECIKEDLKLSEHSEDICIESQFVTTEVHDAELNITDETIEPKVSTTTDKYPFTSENVSYDDEEIKTGSLKTHEDINEDISSIDEEFQVMSENIASESFEKLSEKIDENLLEIEKELYESVPYEYDDIIAEELNMPSSALELDDATVESTVEETEISETYDTTMTKETKLGISKEETEISEIADALTKEKAELESSELEIETSEATDTVMEEEPAERNIDETYLIDEDKFLYDDQQIYGLDAFEVSGDLSDDNVSSHSSVSTEIAVSMKVALKESEGDECSLNLEQIDNFEDDSEMSLIRPSQKTEDNEQNIPETDLVQLKKSEEVSDVVFSKEQKHEFEAENFESDHKIESEECENELAPIPFMYDPFTDIYMPKVLLKESFSEENVKCEGEISDGIEKIIDDTGNEDKITGVIECDKIKDHVLLSKDSLHTESVVPEIIETTDSENKSTGLEKDEIGALMAEECIMSRLYDEWYQSESSTKFSFLSAESIYAKFGKSESSESENESDSALSTVDFKGDTNETVAYKSESSIETQISEKDIIVYESEEKNQEKEIVYEKIKYDAIDISQDSTELDVSEVKKEVDVPSDLSVEFKLKSIKDDQQIVQKVAEESVVSKDTEISSFIQEKTELDISEVKNEVDKSSDLSVEYKLKSIRDDQQMIEKEAEESVVSKDIEISSFIQEKTELDITEVKNEVDILSDPSVELKLKSIKEDQQMVEKVAEESVVCKDTEISSFIQEKTESGVLQIDAEVSIHSIKDQEKSDSEKMRVNNKFSTSKSCQTEDSFEEDVFFDSFDDTFTIPSYIHLPIENQTKPPSTDISIQCELISIDDILSSKEILNISQREVITTETQMIMPEQEDARTTEEPKLREQQPRKSELASEEKEESSCESFEDSDSDIFIESPSSQDELDVGSKRGLLYAEVDSDTGFSSGSECGWTKRSDYKQKELKKVSQTSTASKIISLQTTVSPSEGQEVAVSVDSSFQEKTVEISSVSEKKMATDIIESDKILSDSIRSSPLPPEIIERAITPVAIPQFPSFDDDLVFVEVKEDVEEITDNIEEEIISATSTTPTVEYFYGPLPETVKIDSPPESNENFFETASELSESTSFSVDKTESFSDSTSSLPLVDKISHELNIESNISSITKGSEDESFGETISSLKGETEDSISEYYSFPESVSLLSRASLAESDIFDFAQSEIRTDDFLVDSNYEEKKVKSAAEKVDLSVSESNKISGLISDKSDDEQPQAISRIVSVTDAKETHVSSDDLQVTESKKFLDDQTFFEKTNEILSINNSVEIGPSVEIEKTAPAGELIDSKAVLSTEEAQILEVVECEPVIENIIKPSSDVPPVPSDIVRYLYYDDSITFDDESYHTQSGSIEAPSLTSQEAKLIDSTYKEAIDEAKEKIPIKEVCTIPSFQATSISEEKITVSTVKSETESILSDELTEKKSEMLIQDFSETPIVLESSPDKTDLATDSATKTSEKIIDLAEKTPESKEHLLENIPSLSETDLKFPSIEVLPLESAAILPAAAEQTFESVVCKEEAVIVSDTSFEDALALSRDQDVEPVGFRQTSSEIPPVPSDIVRYLYYDDDISFDEMTQSSFHSEYDNEVSGLEGAQLPMEAVEGSNLKPVVSAKPELLQDIADTSTKLSSELYESTHEKPYLDKFDMQLKLSDEESSSKPDSGSAKDESNMPLDSSECYEDWFDLKETTDILKRDSEQYSSTRSSALKEDSEPPCIPEYILSPKLSDNIPIGKNDVDEVTDISTHFTMTDDSDRFSDIENDISLNFEEEYSKDEELFESCMKGEYDEMSEIEDAENEFQFLTPEQIKEHPELEKITESPKEIAAELPKEQLKESVTSTELNVLQTHEETKLELSEVKGKSDMRITSTDSSKLFKEQTIESLPVDELPEQRDDKEIIQQYVSHEYEEKSGDITENFDECITSTSEVSKDEFAECLTSSELVEQRSDKSVQKKIEEFFDECITTTEVSDISKEQFVECPTSSKLSVEKVEFVDKIMPESSSKELPQQLNEYTESDENGNFPEPILKEVTVFDSTEMKDNISSEILETSSEAKKIESSLAEKDGENEIVDVSLEYSKPSHDIPEKEVLSHEKLEVNLQQTEIVEAISADKDDLETSCYTTPVDESHSISTEVSDNWSDADGIYIEEDESVYDIPLEDINIIHSDICASSEESKEKLSTLEIDFVKSEPFSSESKVTDSEKIDISALKFSEKEVKEIDLKITETASISSLKSDMKGTTDDLNIKLIESTEKKQSEMYQGYSYESDKISEIGKILVSDEVTKSLDSEKSNTFKPDSLSGEKSEQSQILHDNLLSSDMKFIHEVKLETQSEISSTLKEKVHFECMSTTSGAEPTFSQAEMIHESQNIQSEQISSKEVCLGEEVITSTLTQAYAKESCSKDQITSGTAAQEAQVSDVDILETSDFKTMGTKSVEILDSELSEYISISDSSKSNELSLNNVPPEVNDKELILRLSPEDKITEEFGQSLVTSTPQIETGDHVSTKSCDIKDEFSFIFTDVTQESTQYSISENVELEKVDTAKSIEIVDFKGDLSKIDLESIPKTTPDETISVFPDEDSNKKVHSIMTKEGIDFKGCKIEQNIIETEEKIGISAAQFDINDEKYKSETVDFKGTIVVDEDHINFKMNETTAVISEKSDLKFIQDDKFFFGSNIPSSEVVDFKGEIAIDDFCNKTGAADKSCGDELPVAIDKKESKTEITCEPFEVVDFKIITDQDMTDVKTEKETIDFKSGGLVDEKISAAKEIDLIVQKKEGPFETIDFKGQLINLPESEKISIASVPEAESTFIEIIETSKKEEALKPVEIVKTSVIEESFPIKKEIAFHKAGSSEKHEVVDFKGQLTAHHNILESVVDNATTTISDSKFIGKIEILHKDETYESEKLAKTVMTKDSKQIDSFDVVDFKGSLSADELKIQSDDKIMKDAPTIKEIASRQLESDTIKVEPEKEVVDFKGIIDSSCPEIGMSEKKSDTISYDSQETSYSFADEQDIVTYDQPEIYSYNIDEQAVIFDPRETYGYSYGFDEQAVVCESQQDFQYVAVEENEVLEPYDSHEAYGYSYDFDEQEAICESQTDFQYGVVEESELQQRHYEEVKTPEAVSYITSTEESAELYSCAETLSAASDTSLQFHSLSHDLEDTLNVSTSEDFTDVPSHLTSTEDSDKWSDVEGDFSLEDVEYDRDKTPTRTPHEITTILKEKFKSNIDDTQLGENLTESIAVKVESTFSSDSEKLITSTSELVTSDLSAKIETRDAMSEEIAPDSQKIKEAKESEICTADTIKVLEKSIPEAEITDQIISDKSIKAIGDIKTAEDNTSTPLMEHFADIQSLKDYSSTTVVPFSSIDIEKAVPKMHEDIGSDVSSTTEKTESERWLEAETDHSVSELSEDIAVCIEEDGETKFIFVDYEKPAECFAKISEPSETPHTSTTSKSSSSSYSDFENSDHTSDTYADTSLQGATTESSDKWSDFETEDLVDDVLYDNIEIPETVEITDFSQLIKKTNESKLSTKTPSPEDNLKDVQGFESAADTTSVQMKMEIEEVKIIKEDISDLLKESESTASVESTEFSSTNVTDFEQTFSTETSTLPSSAIAKMVVGLSDEEFTDVTPLEITAESDKLSDISDDTSFGEMVDEGSISLKANLKGQDQKLDAVSHECKTDSTSKFEKNENVDLQHKVSKEEKFIEKLDEEISIQSNLQLQSSNDVMSTQISGKEHDIPVAEVSKKLDEKLIPSVEESEIYKQEEVSSLSYTDTPIGEAIEASVQLTDSSSIKSSETFAEQLETAVSQAVKEISSKEDIQALKIDSKLEVLKLDSITTDLKDKIDVEDSSSSKITDDSETLDNFTDVPTHTVTSETSDAYLDLESDHSFEEIENFQTEAESTGLQETQAADVTSLDAEVPQDTVVAEHYENSLPYRDILEEADDFALDVIPENELENYEDDEYSLSEHFEINEDELIYPLPYNDDWIEQSFELKEYGVEAEFYESETDIHGLGVAHEEYDDEDIQRAIDYNLSTFEEDEDHVENVITTESFKTLSHDSSPHLKPDEYETWSTADAPSIEEELGEQDNVLSKIDEILAEDFGDIYQADSYLKHEEDVDDYLSKDISAYGDKCDDFIPSDKISLTKFDSGATQEDTVHGEVTQKQSFEEIMKTELDTEAKISQVKGSSETFETEIISSKMKTGEKLSLKTESETTAAAITVQEDTSHIHKTISDSLKKEDKTAAVIEDRSIKMDFDSAQQIDSKPIFDKAVQKAFSEVPKTGSDTVLSDRSVDKNAVQTFKTESSSLSSEITVNKDYTKAVQDESEELTCKLTAKKDSKLEIKSDSEIIPDELALKKSFEKVSKAESDVSSSEMTLEKDSVKKSGTEFDSVSGEIDVEKDYVETLKTKSEEVPSEINIKRGRPKPESKPDIETISDDVTLKRTSERGSKVDSGVTSFDVTLDKDSVHESKIKSESITGEITVEKDKSEIFKTESESVSSIVSLKSEVKPISDELTIKKLSKEDSKAEFDVASDEVILKKDSIKETKIKSDSLSKEVISDEVSLKRTLERDSKMESDVTSFEVNLGKDSVHKSKIKSESITGEITVEKDKSKIFKTESESVSSVVSLKRGSKSEVKPVSEITSDELTVKKLSKKDSKAEFDVGSDEVTLKKDSIKETKIKSDSLSKEITLKKDDESTLKTECEVMSDKISIQRDFKSDLKTDSDLTSSKILKKDYEKDSKTDSDVISSEMTLKKESIRETKFVSDAVSSETIIKKDSEQIVKLEQDSAKKDETLLKSTEKIPEEQITSIKETSAETKITKSVESKDISSSTDVSTAVISSLSDTHKDKTIKNQFSDVATLSVSKTDSSADIPLTKSQEMQKELATSCKISKESEVTEPPPSSLLSESVKHSTKSASESMEVQLNIPEQKVHKDETSSVTDTISKEQTSDSLVVEVKPDIPKKTKQKSLDLTEAIPIKEELDKKPSLPPKKCKRHSLTDSASSSPGESLSSSSSAESLGSFESAISDKSKKSSDETSMHSLSLDVPTRRSRASKTSSSRSTSRDSDDSSSCSRSSSLKIRRRSSNFAEPEPFDLSKKRASIDERMKKLQIEGKCTTKEKAFIAAKLIEMQFEEDDALLASRQCNTVYNAVKFLTQLCEMCNCRFPINLMSSLVNCTHKACKECLKAHFTSLLHDRSVFTLLCPICHKPDITDQNIQEYFTHLDMTLRNILDDKVYDLFQRKLRDEVLTKDPNFHWCSQCSSGFIASPRLKKLYCPDCSAITCAMCHQTWELEHEGVHCERFQQWKDMHTPEPPPAGLVKFLIDRGISCPSCGLVYAQACGGCMMYKCSHCSFEFCGFCIRPLKKGRECSNEICDSRGHHIHHLHNCLFFLRDKDITEIQMLLEEESVTYFTIPPKNQIVKTRCQVREQKINHGVLTEDRCGRSIEPYCGGLCRTHYYEYLAELLRKNNISPLSIMTIQDLQFMLRKSRIFVPEKVKGETSEDYYERLLEFVTKSIT